MSLQDKKKAEKLKRAEKAKEAAAEAERLRVEAEEEAARQAAAEATAAEKAAKAKAEEETRQAEAARVRAEAEEAARRAEALKEEARRVEEERERQRLANHSNGLVPVGTFQQYLQAERNKQFGVEARKQEAALEERRARTREIVLERAKERTLEQRNDTGVSDSLREHRIGVLERAAAGKAATLDLRERALLQKEEWVAQRSKLAFRSRSKMQRKLEASRVAHLEERRRKALDHKEAAERRRAEAQRASHRELADRKYVLERARRENRATAEIEAAKQWTLSQKVDAAKQVRASVQVWTRQRERTEDELHAKASLIKEGISESRKAAVVSRSQALQARARQAGEVRQQLKEFERRRLSTATVIAIEYRKSHDLVYTSKYASAEKTSIFDESEYGQMVLQSRRFNGQGDSSLGSGRALKMESKDEQASAAQPEVGSEVHAASSSPAAATPAGGGSWFGS